MGPQDLSHRDPGIGDMSVTDVLMTRAATNGYSHPRPWDPGMWTRERPGPGVGMGRIQEMLVGYSQLSGAADGEPSVGNI